MGNLMRNGQTGTHKGAKFLKNPNKTVTKIATPRTTQVGNSFAGTQVGTNSPAHRAKATVTSQVHGKTRSMK